MRKLILPLALATFLILFSGINQELISAPCPPPPAPQPPGCTPTVPIDTGLYFLVAIGAAFGGYRKFRS